MTPIKPLALALLACAATSATADMFDGDYRIAANSDCALIGVDGGAIRIKDGVFTGVESACRMTKPVDVLNMDAQLFTMECSGEGSAWTERAMVMHKAEGDGIIMIWNGYAFVYDRCPAPATPTPADAASSDTAEPTAN